MHDPDLEGFVRMDGVKGRRYLAIKRDKFAYYNTHNVSTPPPVCLSVCPSTGFCSDGWREGSTISGYQEGQVCLLQHS